jgi:hypothetical protein
MIIECSFARIHGSSFNPIVARGAATTVQPTEWHQRREYSGVLHFHLASCFKRYI